MNADQDEHERAWQADRRDFVADRRDQLADDRDQFAGDRDQIADEREELADQREAALDEWERALNARALELGLAQEDSEAAAAATAARVVAREARGQARELRLERVADRDLAALGRREAMGRREEAMPDTRLASAFAELARHFFAAGDFAAILDRITAAAVGFIDGCEMASITVRDRAQELSTPAWTHPDALAFDTEQYRAEEGPCLDALDEPVVYAPQLPDPRWPALGRGPADGSVRAVASFRLAAASAATVGSLSGSLNSYGTGPDAFDDRAREIGLVLAAHAAVVAKALNERDEFTDLKTQLTEALSSRDVIGQAKGILMERLRITPEDAFDALRRTSQHLNIKVSELAEQLARTGQVEGN